MRQQVRCVAAAAALLFAGCATTPDQALQGLASAKACCATLSQLDYAALAAEGANVTLDAASPAFAFASGKSFFKAFRLPERPQPYFVTVRSFAQGETIRKAHIFFPEVTLLDGAFNVLAVSKPADFTAARLSYAETASVSMMAMPVAIIGSVAIERSEARYVVVHTTDQLLRASLKGVVPTFASVILPGVVGAVPTGYEMVEITHSPFAMMHVGITEQPHPALSARRTK